MKLPMVWLDWLKAVFSEEQDNELDSLPGCSRRSSSKAGKALCLLSYLKQTHTPSCLALLCEVSDLPSCLLAQVLLGHVASRRCFWSFWSQGAGRHSLQWMRLRFSFLPGRGQTGPSGWQNSLFEKLNQADLHTTEIHGRMHPNLVVQINEADG